MSCRNKKVVTKALYHVAVELDMKTMSRGVEMNYEDGRVREEKRVLGDLYCEGPTWSETAASLLSYRVNCDTSPN